MDVSSAVPEARHDNAGAPGAVAAADDLDVAEHVTGSYLLGKPRRARPNARDKRVFCLYQERMTPKSGYRFLDKAMRKFKAA
jgi:hypothetical protein